MDPETVQIDFERACNLEQSHGRFNFGDSCLILDESGLILASLGIGWRPEAAKSSEGSMSHHIN